MNLPVIFLAAWLPAMQSGAAEYDPAIPTPDSVLGYPLGSRVTDYAGMERYLSALAEASPRVVAGSYGSDYENRELWEKLSPFNSVEKIVTPTLIMGGEKDWNIPIHNSELLYQALRRLGRTTQLVVYPDEHHIISRPTFVKDLYER